MAPKTLGWQLETVAQREVEVLVDPLTGLWNHRAFRERLHDVAATGTRCAVVVVDVDDFAAVNAAGGYATGDRVLAAVAARLLDVAGPRDTVARIGGDEFALVLAGATAADAQARLERACDALAATELLSALRVTVSAGVCESAGDRHADGLLARATAALPQARALGGDATAVHPADRRDDPRALGAACGTLTAIRALARAIDAKDRSTREHSDRVARIARRLAQTLGWSPADIRRLHEAALIHDVGKIGVPDAVLLKPDRLDPNEYEVVKRHAELGADIAAGLLEPEQVEWIRGHHERPDGLGYPDGLRGGRISGGAAILAVADAFDVMTVERPYSRPKTVPQALAEFRRLVGRQFTREPVSALLQLGTQRLSALR